MKRGLFAGGLLLAFALFGSPAQAQTGTARGKVMDEKGQPVPDVAVLLEFQGGVTRNFNTKTNKKGEFTQVGVPPGVYKFTVTKEGYQGSSIEFKIDLGEISYIPDMKITSRAAAAGAADKSNEELRASFKAAAELIQAGKYDEAETAFKDIAAKHPTVAEAHFNLGYIYGQKNDWAKAIEAYQKALEIRPDYAEAKMELARAYQQSGQSDKAMAVMTAEGSDKDAKMQFNLGVMSLNANKYDDAEAAFKKAAELDPTNPEPHYYLGTVAVNKNNTTEAVAHFEKYLSMSPQNAQNVATAQALLQALKPKK